MGTHTHRYSRIDVPLASRALMLAALVMGLLSVTCRAPTTQETLLIAGSSAMKLYLDPLVQAFAAKNANASVVCEGGGAAAGVIALKRQAIDIAMITRDLAPDEDDDNLRDFLVARDGVAIVASKANPVAGLTSKQLADIASGAVTSWKDVGGRDERITFVDRPRTSHLRKSFVDLVLGGEEPMRTAVLAASNDEMAAILKANAGAVGYVSYHSAAADLKVLPINGVEMNRATMLSGRYPLTRSFYLAVYVKPGRLAESFVSFAMSKEGQSLLVDKGLLAVY
jgi:phosphate transport system substrate-binding protein